MIKRENKALPHFTFLDRFSHIFRALSRLPVKLKSSVNPYLHKKKFVWLPVSEILEVLAKTCGFFKGFLAFFFLRTSV